MTAPSRTMASVRVVVVPTLQIKRQPLAHDRPVSWRPHMASIVAREGGGCVDSARRTGSLRRDSRRDTRRDLPRRQYMTDDCGVGPSEYSKLPSR